MLLSEQIAHLKPCAPSVPWLDGYSDLQTAWDECPRGDWMLGYAGKLSGPPESESRRMVVACAADCAALALPKFELCYPDDKIWRSPRPWWSPPVAVVRECIDACYRWADGRASIDELCFATAPAIAAGYAASTHAVAYAAAYAAYAAVYTAHVADDRDPGYAAYTAVARAADAFAGDDYDYVACSNALKRCADIVRGRIREVPRALN